MMILGVVRLLQPIHGYDVRRTLLSWQADRWANVQPGSIYHGLKKLAEERALREVGTEQVGSRPARTSYELTPKGDDQLQDLLRRNLWALHDVEDPFVAAFSLIMQVSRDEAVAALRNRARVLQAANDSMVAAIKTGWAVSENKPTHVRWMLELRMARNDGEIAWCGRVAEQIEAGVAYMSPELMAKVEQLRQSRGN